MFLNKISGIGYNISIFKNHFSYYLYVYSKNYFMLIKINTNPKKKNNLLCVVITKTIDAFIKQFVIYTNNKIKFTGKGYKIKKNHKNNLILLFNRSHITNIFYCNVFLKKIKKYKIYVYGTNDNIYKLVKALLNVRYINIFTKKGLRSSRQIILKKKSKK